MNANLDLPGSIRTKAPPSGNSRSRIPKPRTLDPLARRTIWFTTCDDKWTNHYNEEWLAFFKQQAMQKSKTVRTGAEPEPLCRVWNISRR